MRVPSYKPQEDGRPPGVLKDMRWDPERLLNKLGCRPLRVYDRRYDNHHSPEQKQWPAPSLNGIQDYLGAEPVCEYKASFKESSEAVRAWSRSRSECTPYLYIIKLHSDPHITVRTRIGVYISRIPCSIRGTTKMSKPTANGRLIGPEIFGGIDGIGCLGMVR